MSDLDKTSKQLIDSIRKTKSGDATAAVKSVKKTPSKPKVARSKTSPATSIAKKTNTKTNKQTTARKKTTAKLIASTTEQVPYPDGSTVWPD